MVLQNLPLLPPARGSQELAQASSQDVKREDVEQLGGLGGKRKFPEAELDHWIETGCWPESFHESNKMSEHSKKRPRATSYAQSIKDGDNPRAYTPGYEKVLEKAGIFMDAYPNRKAISDSCQQLCSDLLSGEYEPPESSHFHGDRFWTILQRVRTRNESRVFRDITPSIVPSAELLYAHGNCHLEHLAEEVNAVWTKCTTLAGPQPKPDFAVGLMPSAFTEEEALKLKIYTTPDRATFFTENMYFPFLMCEAKSVDQAINRADRQNAHSASIAINAIVQLHRAITPPNESEQENRAIPRVEELENKILAFSISHDNNMVKIYGHFTSIQGGKRTFSRHPIRSFDFTELNGKGRWIAYNFTRKVYDTFAPIHLKRIRTALARLPAPPPPETGVDTDAGEEDSQRIAASVPSSQDDASFKKPPLPQLAKMQRENDRLKDQVDLLLRQQQEQQRQQQEQMRQQQEQMRQQQELNREQVEQYKEIIKMLRDKE
ncbi:hypothetical protein FQN54_005432 [Arachnomyces sp. PD_36]|nr:hypothetical protein FQN54_005432 [Arachnomyces sp. PD_36]